MKLLLDSQKIIEQFIRTRVNDAGAKGVVLGLSGGIDSAVTLALSVSALGPDNVVGLIMPFNQSESIALASNHAKKLGVKTVEYNISDIVSSFKEVSNHYSSKTGEGNLHSRIRMSLLYGESFSSNCLVIGTSNKSELLVGYYTKWGDGASDFLPIGDLYKTQVYAISKDLGVPSEIIERPPTAELWEGQTDESELGIDYGTLDQILLGLERQIPKKDLSLKSSIGIDLIIKIENLIKLSIHKRVFPPVCKIGRRTVGLDWRETIGSK